MPVRGSSHKGRAGENPERRGAVGVEEARAVRCRKGCASIRRTFLKGSARGDFFQKVSPRNPEGEAELARSIEAVRGERWGFPRGIERVYHRLQIPRLDHPSPRAGRGIIEGRREVEGAWRSIRESFPRR